MHHRQSLRQQDRSSPCQGGFDEVVKTLRPLLTLVSSEFDTAFSAGRTRYNANTYDQEAIIAYVMGTIGFHERLEQWYPIVFDYPPEISEEVAADGTENTVTVRRLKADRSRTHSSRPEEVDLGPTPLDYRRAKEDRI